ncbi:hypothetical protein MJO28_015772 [Puccinia striiformis f. sp. tritici]|uniref:Uncharacterized protein n=1 Tax=Puccinia striiformis f. sp. tritici TaxID=168172 RepID=A0ACC0DPV5_9BASI|nr:hypothetical protein Pst134EA_029257 [Puccinia striiformis f. sp. tritici]KAH9441248.1 hypothetical protein Pst134EB_029915 [Puccinia striiformis f. sp. tritici]KAH9447222.1 hypothetical protein Pst134EA_029257 [Puccinia striiformis f. sp. tritici]KAI7936317.1 hypothetical protein MJO29_015620 [Puccinia striiformis f. sp. tritici]KAI7936873.1 hypothetical protein MJO28_015772 [Puccinia striiformis f. sp. tritici]
MNIFSYYLVFVPLVLRAIAPALPPEELPLSDDISRGIAEQLVPASERVQSGPLEEGTTPAGGGIPHRRDSTRLSERTHDATSVHSAQRTNAQSALDGQQSQWRDHEAVTSENSRPTVQPNRLVRSLRPISRCMLCLSWPWRKAQRIRKIKIQVREQYDAFLHTLTEPTRGMIGPLLYLGTSGYTMKFRFAIFLDETSPIPIHWIHISTTISLVHNNLYLHNLCERLEGLMQEALAAPHTKSEHNLQPGDLIPNTKTLGYMPRPPDYEPEKPGANGIKTISLDQAIIMLEASSTNVFESGRMNVDGTLKEQRAHTNREETEDESSRDHITSQKSIHHDAEGSTRPTSSILDVSEVLLGDPLHTTCLVCHEEFSQPEKNSENAWVFEQIIKMDNCNHYFHTHCIGGWIFGEHKISCPTCREEVFTRSST